MGSGQIQSYRHDLIEAISNIDPAGLTTTTEHYLYHCTSQILRDMSTTTTATTESTLISGPSDSAEQLISQLDGTHTLPLWAQMAKLNPAEPNPRCTPHVWRYGEMRPYLLRAGSLITEKQAERRVLMLVNPSRGKAAFYPSCHTQC
jgi:hypothetical protein